MDKKHDTRPNWCSIPGLNLKDFSLDPPACPIGGFNRPWCSRRASRLGRSKHGAVLAIPYSCRLFRGPPVGHDIRPKGWPTLEWRKSAAYPLPAKLLAHALVQPDRCSLLLDPGPDGVKASLVASTLGQGGFKTRLGDAVSRHLLLACRLSRFLPLHRYWSRCTIVTRYAGQMRPFMRPETTLGDFPCPLVVLLIRTPRTDELHATAANASNVDRDARREVATRAAIFQMQSICSCYVRDHYFTAPGTASRGG